LEFSKIETKNVKVSMNKLLTKIADQSKKARFASFLYRNNKNELARYKIQLGFNYINLVEKSALQLQLESENMQGQTLDAAKSLLASFQKTIEGSNFNPAKAAYKPVKDRHGKTIQGVKLNQNDNSLQVYGLICSKIIIENGKPVKKSSSLNSVLRSNLPVGRFREFNLEGVKVAKMDGDVLVLE